ncbi:MAG: pyridoxine 5'-phosphate synthase [Verrucomicrobiales bacterium]|nr:pyridoxine 5'-phosphate synthase [Verrucomicrobiales bacterium]
MSSQKHLKLGVNIDHVATLRQARYAPMLGSHNAEPSVLAAANEAEANGADSITVHLRLDRRHIQDCDVFELRENIRTALNLEMGNTREILDIALKAKPDFACIVPENRREVTTEGGLNVRNADTSLQRHIKELQDAGIKVSLFIDPEVEQVRAAAKTGAEMIEIHTGAFANAAADGGKSELKKIIEAAEVGHGEGLQINAGHGITISNLPTLLRTPYLAELNIGHHLVSRGVFIGLGQAVREMRTLMDSYPHFAST